MVHFSLSLSLSLPSILPVYLFCFFIYHIFKFLSNISIKNLDSVEKKFHSIRIAHTISLSSFSFFFSFHFGCGFFFSVRFMLSGKTISHFACKCVIIFQMMVMIFIVLLCSMLTFVLCHVSLFRFSYLVKSLTN